MVVKKACFGRFLIKTWVAIDNGILLFFCNVFGCGVKKIKIVSGFDVELTVLSKIVYPILLFLRLHSLCLCSVILDIVCYDVPSKSSRFVLVYNLLSLKLNFSFRVTTKLRETFSKVLSVVSIFKSVGWSEREVFDFYGLFFFF